MRFYYFIFFLLLFSCTQNKKQKDNQSNTNIYYDKAWDFKDKKVTDSAVINFYKAKDLFLKKNDSVGAGKCLINIGIILTEKGDYFGAQETSLDATKYFNNKNPENYDNIRSNYNNLGIASYNLKDYENAIKFYDFAINYSGSDVDIQICLNNKAKALQDNKKYNEALIIYNDILNKRSKNNIEYARAITNLSKAKWLQNPSYNPIPEFRKALNLRLKEEDIWGQNSSYAHLSDYYIKNNKLDSALLYANKMYRVAKELKSPDDQIEALQKLIVSENSDQSKKYFQIYQKLYDSISISRSKAKNQFAIIRYDVEKIKAKNAENEFDILLRNIILTALSLSLIGGIFWYRKRKKRLQQEKELEVKNTQLKMSKKVHDVVANGIYQVMTKIENQEHFDKDEALDELEYVYEKSRDISYEKNEIKDIQPFDEKISALIASFKNDTVNTYIAGNGKSIWENLPASSKDEVYQIIRELLVNMKKHSQASTVAFKFEKLDNIINIQYTDNGIGISGDLIRKNGLTNTGTRIEAIQGKIIFETNIEKGLKIYISFPTS
ncbi:ATP-binding protein [Chryseobacterium sp.]|uniref:tetratricopeptide repeat-containing sensor histidine kinase n=1 Tax=Chryseobacterium sp. TaxID=1871047 RepID=UPI002898F376|nr:ATP-binding protein [Chryseobacterium sp.]